jgi:hypothetical protein
MPQAGEQQARWALWALLAMQLLSFALIASQHATIQQLRGEAAPASRGRRLLQAGQPGTTASATIGSLPSSLVAFEGGRIVLKAHVAIQPSQAAVDSYYGTGTFRAMQPALQIDQALLTSGSGSADAAAAPAIATQSPTQPISLQGPLTANTVTAGTLQTTAGGALMSGAAVVAGSLQTTGAAAVLSGGSLTCSLVTADVLQTTDAVVPPEQPANGTAGGAQQQQQQGTRGVTISGGVVSAAALQGDAISATGTLQGGSLDVGTGTISGGSVSAQRIAAPSGTLTVATMLAQNVAVNQKLTALDVTVKGDAMFESDAEIQGITTLGRKANTQPVLNVLGTARTAALQTTTATIAGQTSTKSLIVQTTTNAVGATTIGSLVVNQGVEGEAGWAYCAAFEAPTELCGLASRRTGSCHYVTGHGQLLPFKLSHLIPLAPPSLFYPQSRAPFRRKSAAAPRWCSNCSPPQLAVSCPAKPTNQLPHRQLSNPAADQVQDRCRKDCTPVNPKACSCSSS